MHLIVQKIQYLWGHLNTASALELTILFSTLSLALNKCIFYIVLRNPKNAET